MNLNSKIFSSEKSYHIDGNPESSLYNFLPELGLENPLKKVVSSYQKKHFSNLASGTKLDEAG